MRKFIKDIILYKMLSGGNLQDEMLRAYIDKIFDKYDTDHSGTLD